MAPPDFSRAMPVLQVADVAASEAFYVSRLGFTSHGIWGDPPAFCIVQRGQVTIALDRSRDDAPVPLNQYWAAYVYVADADALHLEFGGQDVEIVRGPEDMPYGLRDFDIRDPDGHLICFGYDLQPADTGPGLQEPSA